MSVTLTAVPRGRRTDGANVRKAPPAAPMSTPPIVRMSAPTAILFPNATMSSNAWSTWMKISRTRSTPYQVVNNNAAATSPPAASPTTAPYLAALEVVASSIRPATIRGRTATYAAANGESMRMTRAPVTWVPIRLIVATFASRPVMATNSDTIPPTNPVRINRPTGIRPSPIRRRPTALPAGR